MSPAKTTHTHNFTHRITETQVPVNFRMFIETAETNLSAPDSAFD